MEKLAVWGGVARGAAEWGVPNILESSVQGWRSLLGIGELTLQSGKPRSIYKVVWFNYKSRGQIVAGHHEGSSPMLSFVGYHLAWRESEVGFGQHLAGPGRNDITWHAGVMEDNAVRLRTKEAERTIQNITGKDSIPINNRQRGTKYTKAPD